MAKANRVRVLNCLFNANSIIVSPLRSSSSGSAQQRSIDSAQEFGRRYHIANDPDESNGQRDEETLSQVNRLF